MGCASNCNKKHLHFCINMYYMCFVRDVFFLLLSLNMMVYPVECVEYIVIVCLCASPLRFKVSIFRRFVHTAAAAATTFWLLIFFLFAFALYFSILSRILRRCSFRSYSLTYTFISFLILWYLSTFNRRESVYIFFLYYHVRPWLWVKSANTHIYIYIYKPPTFHPTLCVCSIYVH